MIIHQIDCKATVPCIVRKRLRFYFHFVGWENISLGIHVNLRMPNVELHLPFGFIRAGFVHEPFYYFLR